MTLNVVTLHCIKSTFGMPFLAWTISVVNSCFFEDIFKWFEDELKISSNELKISSSKIEKVPGGIRGEKSSKDMASSRN